MLLQCSSQASPMIPRSGTWLWHPDSNSWLDLGLSTLLWTSLVIWSSGRVLVQCRWTCFALPVWVWWLCSLVSEVTASASHITMLSSHLPLPCGATCPCCSLTRCTQNIVLRLAILGDVDKCQLPVHEFQKVREEKQVQRHFLELPKEEPICTYAEAKMLISSTVQGQKARSHCCWWFSVIVWFCFFFFN